MNTLWIKYWRDALVVLVLFALPLLLFWQVTLGGQTLIPADNLYQWEPWRSEAAAVGVDAVPHNELLSDLVLENFAWKRFILKSLHQPGEGLTNRLPLWNPYLWAGAPFWADGQHSVMYPFSILFYVLPLSAAYGWFTVIQFWLAGVCMYVLARTLGSNRVGGLIAGMTYQLSSIFVVSTVFTMIIASMPWLPLLLAIIEQVIRQQSRAKPAAGTVLYVVGGALALGFLMLAGHPEYTAYTGMVMGIYTLARLLYQVVVGRGQGEVWRRAIVAGLWLLLMVGLGACIGAAQFVPLYEYAQVNFRQGSASYQEVVGWAFPKRRLIAMLIPNFFGNPSHHRWFDILRWQWMPVTQNIYGEPTSPPQTIYWGIKNAVEGGSYVGILPLFLALIAVWGRGISKSSLLPSLSSVPYSWSRFYTWFFTFLALFSLTLVYGLPTYRLIFALPFLNQLHSPFRWLFPYTLSVAVLAGLGTTYLSGAERKMTSATSPFTTPNMQRTIGWPVFWAGVVGVGGLLLSLLFADRLYGLAERAVHDLALADRTFESGRMFFMYQWPNLLVFALMLVAAGAVLRITRCPIYLPDRAGGYGVWKLLAVLVVALDLFLAGYGFNPAADPRWLSFVPPAVRFLQERQQEDLHFRITSYVAPHEKTFNANGPWLYDIQDVRGYGSIISKQYMDYMSMISNQYEALYNRVAPISTDQWWALDSPLLDLLNVKYVVTTQAISSTRYSLVYAGEVRIYENGGVMPRAFTLPEQSALYTRDVAGAVQGYDPRYFVILDGQVADQRPTAGQPGAARISRYGHNEVLVDVLLDAPGWLILTDSYFPGWRAYLRPWGGSESDEQEVTIQRHAGQFRAVHLPAGHHTVRFKYTPTSVKVGFFLAFLGMAILVLMAAVWAWQRWGGGQGEQSDSRRVAKNSVAPIVLQLFNKGIDTAFMMLALRILSPQGAGQYYFIVNIVTYTDIFINFGLNIWLQREVAKARQQGGRYLGNTVLLRLALCLAAAPLLILFVLGWGAVVEPLDGWQVWALVLFTVGLIPANVAAALTAMFQAYEKMEHPAAVTVISTIVKAGLGTVTLLLGWGIVGLGGVSIATNLVTVAILGWWMARTIQVPLADLCPGAVWDVRLQGQMLRESWPLMVNNLLSMGFFKVDVLLLKAMQGDIVLGLYSSVAYKLIDAINIIPSSFTFALFPLLSRYAASTQQQGAEALYRAFTLAVRLLVLIALPLALALTTLAFPLSNLIGGSGYMPDSAIALQLMIWSIPLGFVNSITHYVIIAQGRQQSLMITFIVGLLFNIIANAVCIPVWSYKASAVIHILSELVLLAAFYVLLRRDLPHQPGMRAVPWPELLWRPVLAGVAMGLAAWGLYQVNVWLATLGGWAVYVAVLGALGMFRSPEMALIGQLVRGNRP